MNLNIVVICTTGCIWCKSVKHGGDMPLFKCYCFDQFLKLVKRLYHSDSQRYLVPQFRSYVSKIPLAGLKLCLRDVQLITHSTSGGNLMTFVDVSEQVDTLRRSCPIKKFVHINTYMLTSSLV